MIGDFPSFCYGLIGNEDITQIKIRCRQLGDVENREDIERDAEIIEVHISTNL